MYLLLRQNGSPQLRTSEIKEVESRRLTQLTPAEIAAIPRGTAVRLRMRLVRKKDGRFKARILVQGFREPITWDVGGSDSPTASLVSVRSLLFMRGYKHDAVSAIDVSTAFLQADEYAPDAITRHVYYQPGPNMPRVYYKLRGCLYGQRAASIYGMVSYIVHCVLTLSLKASWLERMTPVFTSTLLPRCGLW